VIGTSLFQIIFVQAYVTMLQATQKPDGRHPAALILTLGGVIGAQFGGAGVAIPPSNSASLMAIVVLAVAAVCSTSSSPPARVLFHSSRLMCRVDAASRSHSRFCCWHLRCLHRRRTSWPILIVHRIEITRALRADSLCSVAIEGKAMIAVVPWAERPRRAADRARRRSRKVRLVGIWVKRPLRALRQYPGFMRSPAPSRWKRS